MANFDKQYYEDVLFWTISIEPEENTNTKNEIDNIIEWFVTDIIKSKISINKFFSFSYTDREKDIFSLIIKRYYCPTKSNNIYKQWQILYKYLQGRNLYKYLSPRLRQMIEKEFYYARHGIWIADNNKTMENIPEFIKNKYNYNEFCNYMDDFIIPDCENNETEDEFMEHKREEWLY